MSLLLLLFTVVVLIPCSAAAPHAVQIIAPDESHTQLVVKEESIAFLRNLTGRMGFVGVVGPFHSGKSFLMNQLLPARGNDGKSGFKVGPTVQPETRGVWMWTEPMVVADKSGPLNVFLLDTEGLYASNVSESYDAKIFAVTTLLSSMLLYNSVKIIDQAAIDALEFLVRRSQLFALRAELQATTPRRSLDFRVQFPSLLWVVEDFFQDLQNLTATEWLHQLLLAHKVDDTNKPSSLLKIFNSVDCRTVFLPHSKRAVLQDLSSVKDNELTPEFHEDIASVRQLITEKVQPKLNAAGSDVSGAGYIQLVRVLVRAANEGSFPSVPSVWHAFVKQQVDQARNLSTVYFKDACKSLLEESQGLALPSPEEVTLGLTTAMASAKTIYSDVLIGLDDAPKDGFQRLTADLDSHSSLTRLTYENKLRDVLHAHAGQLKSQCHAYLSSLRLPLSPEELSAADNVTAFHAQFEADTARWRNTDQWRMAVDHFKRDTELSMKTLVAENKNEIDRCLEKASTKAKSIYLAKCIEGLGNGVCSDRFEEVSSEAFATVVAVYTEEVPPGLLKSTTLRNLVRAFQASAESAARDQLKNQCSKENRDKILSVLLSLRATLVQDAKTEFSQLASRMPLLEEEIGEFGAQVQSRKLDEWKSRTGKCYGAFSVWMTETEALQKALAAQTNLNIQLNVAQYMQTVEPALARAKERIQLGSADYWLDFSWRSFAEHAVREELSRSTSLRGKVIERAVKDFIEKEQSEYSGRFWSLALVVGVTVAVFGVLIGLALSIRRSR